jgi:LuxR family maltose regulon positive regulatory protein
MDVEAMPFTLLETKLHIPALRPNAVPRPRLMTRLNEGLARPVTLLSAPPGFGKTTLLGMWLKQLPASTQTAWITLDGGDNDPARFLAYLCAALQLEPPRTLRTPRWADLENVLIPLINRLGESPAPIVVVLDDYHLIAAAEIHQILSFLIDHLPPPLHLVIASRADPPLPLPRLRARDQLVELRLDDLRFTLDEARAFLADVMSLEISAEEAAALAARTEGWITALQLAALSLRNQSDKARLIAAFSGSHAYIADYLTDEVLRQQPEALQSFLLQTSILDRLAGPLCDALTDRTDGQRTLEQLAESNLFLVPLDDERKWFRYHALFADLLRKRLIQTQPDRVADLHRRASVWHEQNGFIITAIDHALASRAFDRAAELTERAADVLWQQGEFASFLRLVEALPQDVVRARPRLCLYHAALLVVSAHSLATAETLLHMVVDHDPAGQWRGEVAVLRGVLDTFKGDLAHSIQLTEQALAMLPDENWFRGLAVRNLSVLYLLKGELTKATELLEKNIAISLQAGDWVGAAATLRRLGSLCVLRGQLRRAREFYQGSVDVCADAQQRPWPVASRSLVHLAELAYEWNDLPAAERYQSQAAELTEKTAPSWALSGQVLLARLKQAQGDRAGAEQAIATARQLAVESDTELDDVVIAAYTARLELAQGNLDAAMRWAQARRARAGQATQRPVKDDEALTVSELILEIEGAIIARIYVAAQQPAEAHAILTPLLAAAEERGRTGSLIRLLTVQALACAAQGERASAAHALQRALALAEPEGYVRTFVDEGDDLRLLMTDFRFWIGAQDLDAEQRIRLLAYTDQLLRVFTPAAHELPTPIRNRQSPIENLVEPLSDREIEILGLIAAGLSNQDIADRLFLALPTIKWYTTQIYGKLGVANRTQAVAKARALDLLKT